MFTMPAHLAPSARPRARSGATVVSGPVRVTVLTSRLLRIEYSPDAGFEDRPTYAFWNRDLPVPHYVTRVAAGVLTVETEDLSLEYSGDGKPFSARNLRCELRGCDESWRYGDREWDHNLGGTIRTLDGIDGRVSLGHGLMSRRGWSVIDDSRSVVFDESGWFARRRVPEQTDVAAATRDLYFFGYGHDYAGCLRDFYLVSGAPSALPRYALGLWWSRYWPYTDKELATLVDEFQSRSLPISVSIVDMDWHLGANPYTNGWTGYSWNTELFPDPRGFLDAMHARGIRVGLNLHPADGVHPHEAAYEQMREAVHADAVTPADCAAARDPEDPVVFAADDARFMDAYLRILHRPLEQDGVDLWWIDWQQGEESELPGLDPLMALNHAHFLDLRRESRHGLVLSRYAGLGSHRYPVGFSGDSIATWESLAFQPELTATAANVGYGCWSHDIGGHMAGTGDPELYARWVQYGVFSPILRVHSSRNPFNVRVPWEFEGEIRDALESALKLRGRLIPYLHTHLFLNSQGELPLCTPMYYHYPEMDSAYRVPAQYMFGADLLVAPFVDPISPDIGLARRTIWLPPGDWYHLFTGERFVGPRNVGFYGGIHDIPVFARAGALIPMQPVGMAPDVPHPAQLELVVVPGAEGRAELIEEDGVCMTFRQRLTDRSLEITVAGDRCESIEPSQRALTIRLVGYVSPAESSGGGVSELAPDEPSRADAPAITHLETVALESGASEQIRLEWTGRPRVAPEHLRAVRVRRLLLAMRVPDTVKRTIGARLSGRFSLEVLAGCAELMTAGQLRALAECVSGHAIEDVLLASALGASSDR